ncbi:hypothetical protein GGI07_004170 [Coemansia sp. Benny D115]|nr:hypothetical protein GGI07_004170 [Coemansia sp. Benny D115]
MAVTKDHCRFCFDVLLAHLTHDPASAAAPVSFDDSVEYPLFVTWDKRDRYGELQLRGCIGNFSPMRLSTGLRDYALTSALHDSRFPPIALRELPLLSCSVSLLIDFESARDYMDWELGTHGVWIEFRLPGGARKTATFLPQIAVEQGWSKLQTIDHLLRKGGYNLNITDDVRRSIKLTRYRSQKADLLYEEYVAMRGTAPLLLGK